MKITKEDFLRRKERMIALNNSRTPEQRTAMAAASSKALKGKYSIHKPIKVRSDLLMLISAHFMTLEAGTKEHALQLQSLKDIVNRERTRIAGAHRKEKQLAYWGKKTPAQRKAEMVKRFAKSVAPGGGNVKRLHKGKLAR